MTESTHSERRRPRWIRWLVGMICLLTIAGVVRLVYPGWRSRQLVAELRLRGFHVGTQSVLGEQWREWTGSYGADAFCRYLFVFKNDGRCTDDDLRVVGQLFRLTYNGLYEPAEPSLFCTSGTAADAEITDHGLEYLRGLTYLRQLETGSKSVTDSGMVHLTGLVHLEDLDLNSGRISGKGLAQLRVLTKLEYLSLCETLVVDDDLVQLAEFAKLTYLNLSGTQVRGSGLIHLYRLPNLTHLLLDSTHLAECGFASLGKLTNLQVLSLSETPFSDKDMVHVAKLKKLEILDLTGTQITDASLPALKQLTALRTLDVDRTRLTPRGIARLRKSLPHVEIKGMLEKPSVAISPRRSQFATSVSVRMGIVARRPHQIF